MRIVRLPFITILLLFIMSFGARAAAPTLVYPNNYMNVADTNINFIWDAIPGAATYSLQLSTDSLFSTIAVNHSGITTNHDSVNGLLTFGNKYFWRVSADGGAYSVAGAFYYYNPTSFPSLSFWLKADGRVVKDAGNNVSAWINEANNSTDTVSQPTAGRQPVWTPGVLCNKPMLHFDGVTQVLVGPTTLQNIGSLSKTYLVVGRQFGTGGAYFAKSRAGAFANRYGLYYNSGFLGFLLSGANNAQSNASGMRTPTGYELVANVINRTTQTDSLYTNDSLLGHNVPSASSPPVPLSSYNIISTTRFLIGGYNNGTDAGEQPGFFLNGYIGEMVFFDDALSTSDRLLASKYLYDKYTPPVNLGPNHIKTTFCSDTIRTSGCFKFYTWSTGASGAAVPYIVVTLPGTYSVTTTDDFGRTSIDSIKVIMPDPNYTGSPKICFGSSVRWDTHLDSTKYHFLWTPGNSTSPSLVINTAGTYSVRVTDSLGCTYTSNPVTFTIDSFKFNINLGPNASLCTGNLLGLQQGANLVSHYQWSTGDTSATISINLAGLYKVTLTDANGCTATDSINITIRGVGPIADFKADTVCSNVATQFTDLSTIANPYNITRWVWTFGDTHGDTIQNPAHLYATAGTYTATLVAESNTGCTSTPVSHQVLVRPTVQAFFMDSTACTGDTTRFFDASTPAAGDSIVAWSWNFGGNFSGLKNPKYLFPTVGNDTVSIIVNTVLGCRDTFARNVTVVNTTAAPSVFGFLAPINYTNLLGPVDTFAWQSSANAVRYVLEISANPTFSNIVYRHEVYQPKDSTSIIPYSNSTYFWRVTAYNLCGASIATETDSFTKFKPSLVGNPSFWVMGDGLVTKNGANRVTQWSSNTGTLNVKQVDPAVAPLWIDNTLNHKPVLRFDGTDSLNGGDILDMRTNSRTSFVVGRSLSPTGTYYSKTFLGPGLNRYALFRTGASRLQYLHQDQALHLVDTAVNNTSYEMVATIADRQNGNMFLNRNDHNLGATGGISTSAYDMNSSYNFLVGAYGYGSAGPTALQLNGDIAEIVMFDSVLDVQSYNDVKRYLYIKYGGGPVYLGPDITINYGFCGSITLNASNRYSKYAWSTGDTTHQTITVTQPGTYSVTVTDVFEQVYTDTIVISKPGIVLPPATAFCLGDSVRWDVNLGPAYHYHFSTGDTTPFLIVHNSGTYTVTITDTIPPSQGGPCSITKSVTFTQDSFRVLASLGPDTMLCRGQYIGLRTQAANAASYLWSDGSTDSTLLVNAAGYYSVIVTSVNGCTAFDTIYVNVSGQVPNVSFFVNPAYCIGDTAHFQNFTTIQSPFQILNYQWQFGDSNTDTVMSPDHLYANTGTYNVTLTVVADSGCTKSLTQTTRINPLPIAAFTHDIGCANSLVKFTDLSTATLADPIVRWVWTFGDGMANDSSRNPLHNFAGPGLYPVSLTVYTLVGCPQTITDTIEIFPELLVAIGAEHLCKGQTVQFHDNSPNVSTVAWTWQFPDNTYSNDSNPTKSFNPTGDYVICLTVKNAIGCINSVCDTITIYDPPTAAFDNPDRCVQFVYPFHDQSVSVTGDSIQSHLWQFGDTTLSVKRNPYHQYADTGVYNVTLYVTTEHGCQDSVSKPVHIIGKPHAAFAFSPNFGGAPIYITFTNLSTSAASYSWDFGDGNVSNDVNPAHTYNTNGSYQVRLIAFNSVGCSDTTFDSVFVVPASLDLLIDTFIVWQDTADNWNMSALVINIGTRTVNYFDIYATLGNGNTVVERVNDTLRTSEYMTYVFKSHFVVTVPNNQTYICTETRNPDGEQDENPNNNRKCAPLKKTIRIISPYPNPAQNIMTFGAVLPAKEAVTITLFDALGTNLGTLFNADAAEGMNYWNIDTELLRSGGYFITMKYRDDTQTIKFVVSH